MVGQVFERQGHVMNKIQGEDMFTVRPLPVRILHLLILGSQSLCYLDGRCA